jgi:hypothetical protein
MFGIDSAFAPLVPLARCPMLFLVPTCARAPGPSATAPGAPVLRVCATVAHRIIDGAAAGRLAGLFADPDRLA